MFHAPEKPMIGVTPDRWAAIFRHAQGPLPPLTMIPDAAGHAERLRALATFWAFDEHPEVRAWLEELADLVEPRTCGAYPDDGSMCRDGCRLQRESPE